MSLEGIFNIISKSPGFEKLKDIFLQLGYRHYSRVMSSSLWKGVFVIGGGTALAQGIGIISTPVITRLYNPSDFGLLGVYSSVLTILLMYCGHRFNQVLNPLHRVQPAYEDDRLRATILLVPR